MIEIIKMFILALLQNASFTLVSRARNSSSLRYLALSSLVSSMTSLIVLKNLITNFDNYTLMLTYVIGSVLGSLLMQYIAMKYFEK